MTHRVFEIDMFMDTIGVLDRGRYVKDGRTIDLKLSRAEMERIQVLLPDEVERCAFYNGFAPSVKGSGCKYNCERVDSYSMAVKRRDSVLAAGGSDADRVLVLNLANPVNPGGGVRKGARAQEEDLCRKSSLLLSLESVTASRYYQYNRSLGTFMGSDALMITPKVEIIKDENGELLDDTVICSVITCAAPMVTYGIENLTEREYIEMFRHRIDIMIRCAAYFGYRRLVLGAWGCGAFGNNARIVSDMFASVLRQLDFNGYRADDLFDSIDFAVLDHSADQYNFNEFYRNFGSGMN